MEDGPPRCPATPSSMLPCDYQFLVVPGRDPGAEVPGLGLSPLQGLPLASDGLRIWDWGLPVPPIPSAPWTPGPSPRCWAQLWVFLGPSPFSLSAVPPLKLPSVPGQVGVEVGGCTGATEGQQPGYPGSQMRHQHPGATFTSEANSNSHPEARELRLGDAPLCP